MASTRPDPLIAEARERWNLCNEAEDAQRKAVVAAKAFRAGDQWDKGLRVSRQGGSGIQGLPPMPPRPCLTVDRLSQPVRQISNTIKTADFGFTVLPTSKGANEQVADILKGYLRRVQNNARGESPIEWAADQAIEGGIGWFRIRTDYVHKSWDGVPTEQVFDQELVLERITNNLSVYCDPYAMKPTRTDARFMFVTEDLSREELKRRYPKADLKGLEDFSATGNNPQGWVTDKSIRIAEYWRVTYQDRAFVWLKNGKIVEGSVAKGADVRMTRTMKVPVVKGSIINAVEELEPFDWVGSRIPLIPILGEELNVDGTVRLRGIIEEGMDAQRMVNYTYSGAMEQFALAPRSPILAEARSVSGYKRIWENANLYPFSYLPFDSWDTDNGRALPPPVRSPADMGQTIAAAAQLMQVSEECVKATTGYWDPSLGNNPRQHSGRAIQSLQAQSDLSSSNYPSNVQRALISAAELMLEVIPKITRPGQIIHILGMDDQPEQVMVGKVFNTQQGGQPQPSIDPTTGQPLSPEVAALSSGLHKFYDLNNGTYSVTVVMGKANATKLEEGSAALGDLIPHMPPEMAMIAIPEYVKQLSFNGANKLAEMLTKALPPALQPQPEGPLPPQAQQIIQGLQGQLQQATQAANEVQAKQNTAIQIAQMDNQTKEKIAGIQAESGVAQAEIKAGIADMQNRIRMMEAMIGVNKEMRLEAAKEGHDVHLQANDQLHEATQNALDRVHEVNQATQQQQAAAQQQAQQPANGNGGAQ